MRPCNKNQFQSIRIQENKKQNATTTQKRQEGEDRKPKETQIETFFHYFSTEGSVERVDFGRFRSDFVGSAGQAQKL